MTWHLQEAKQRFTALVREVLRSGPQVISRHGEDVVVGVSAQEFRELSASRADFKRFFQSAPDVDLTIDRDPTPAPEVSL